MFPPQRIVCLTEETVETLYLLGEDARIVGVSGYAVRPPQVRKEKPRVSAFISADVPKILALEPDLVLTFSDLQADIVAELIRNNVAIHAFNQRDLAGIFDMIRTLGALADIYGLQVAAAYAELPLAQYFIEQLGRPARVGDIVALGPIALLAHQVESGRVATVGLRLAEPEAPETWRERLALWRDKARRLLG
jgi:iron complex transport system substrate-binding protein